MSPFAFGRREGVQREKPLPSFTTDVTDEEDLEEIKKIRQMLNPNEVFVVARQSRLRQVALHLHLILFLLLIEES